MPDDDLAALARELYGGLVDPGLTTYDVAVDADPHQDRVAPLARRIAALFRDHPTYEGVAIRVPGAADGAGIGISTRARIRESLGVAGTQAPPGGAAADWGAGDRAGLPGVSTHYRALLFVCRTCGGGELRAYYDAGNLPRCTAHGVMELVR
ncbi:hypothetical protein BN159_4015 [Streptomyces davaonensis JCM 4913]|uniref:Uncharacterized protein n=1 Tax=Streptomyces davaonensis (strain DSM 101723 / JCM 4913 / KCC S-0913 / 768) TaxID=1214101 RepID=K4R6S1_STRDJ|nr:hypothetical protein [Streptomyces davaonensis]CCK28394.1 hypothetical protein BN159_4015 [Streptomyces davaonensis JCM 4913]